MINASNYEQLSDGRGFEVEVLAFDNGGETMDRYMAVCSMEAPLTDEGDGPEHVHWGITMSSNPFSPQGVCQTFDVGGIWTWTKGNG